ncbi:MAG: J domain-containing protein, partial [Candidatus Electrothrix sp. MAN1_4]|nr:J domain-containing protein [Candidatus Electrothrix sp. MAN1_4]
MQAEQLLIQKISSRLSTEELIFFVAQDDTITSACAELHKKITGKDKNDLKKINLLCQRYHVPFTHLVRELDHIQHIFAPQKTFTNDHKLLGLRAGAGIAEVKQAYRRLSLQYHPDTSGKKNTEQFIEITRAYQRVINNPDTGKKSSPTSSTTWSYREDKPSPQKRTKKYLYLFSFICVALLLIIATLSIHYQKRAMLNTLSKNKKISSVASSPAKSLQQQAPLLPSIETVDTENKGNIEQKKKQEERETVFQGANKTVATNTRVKAPALANSVQKNTDEPSVVPEKTNLAQPVMPKIQPDHNIKKATPFASLPTPLSAQSGNISAKEEAASSQQQLDDKPVAALLKQKEIQDFHDILKIHKEIIPSETKQIGKQQETSSPFSEVQDQKISIIRPVEKKVRPLKAPRKKNTQASQDISIRNSLRAFTTNYAATFMSRNIKEFDLLFADGA